MAAPYQGSLFTHQPLNDALSRLSNALGSDIEALEVRIYVDRLVLQARDRASRSRVLEYVVKDGALSPGTLVELRGPGQLEDNLFSLSEARLAITPEVCARALERVDARAGRISYVLVRRNLPLSTQVQFRIYVSSPIKDGYMDTDAEGHPLDEDRASACPREGANSRRP